MLSVLKAASSAVRSSDQKLGLPNERTLSSLLECTASLRRFALAVETLYTHRHSRTGRAVRIGHLERGSTIDESGSSRSVSYCRDDESDRKRAAR